MKQIKLFVFLLGVAMCGAAPAQPYPSKPVSVIVPFPPGGSSDTVIRAMQVKLTEALGQPIVIDNKPGANGAIGAGQLARAKPDGYTILIGSIGVFAINPGLHKNLSYDPPKDFDLLTVAVRTPNAFVVTPTLPVKTIAELIEHMKKNPGKVSFATSGSGSSDHLTTVLFWQRTGTTGVHVPYKGGGAAINDLIAGHADVLITNLGVVTGHIAAGKMRALAVTSDKRAPELPQTPTMAEAGVEGLEVYSWQGIAAPKGLPADVSAKLHAALTSALNDPGVKKRLDDIGFDVVANSAREFAEFQAAEMARWKAVIDAAGIKAD